MCGKAVGTILKVVGTAASLATGNPMFATIGNTAGGAVSASAEKKKAKAAASAASSALASQQAAIKVEAEKKRKARLPVDVVSQTGGQGLGGTLGS